MDKILKRATLEHRGPTPAEYRAHLVYTELPDGGAYVWKDTKGSTGTQDRTAFEFTLAEHTPQLGSREHMLATLHDVYRYFLATAVPDLVEARSFRHLDATAQKKLGATVAQYWGIKE